MNRENTVYRLSFNIFLSKVWGSLRVYFTFILYFLLVFFYYVFISALAVSNAFGYAR